MFEPLCGKIIAQGSEGSAARPQSSPLMKLPIRPAASPVGTQGAIRSVTCSQGRWRVRANQTIARITPSSPPWKDMPPFQTCDDFERVREIERRLVEQHVAQPAAEHDTEHAVEQQVLDVAPRPARVGELRHLDAPPGQVQEEREAGQVHQAVPVDLDRPERQRDRVELGMHEHQRAFLRDGVRSADCRRSPVPGGVCSATTCSTKRRTTGGAGSRQTRLVSHCSGAPASGR